MNNFIKKEKGRGKKNSELRNVVVNKWSEFAVAEAMESLYLLRRGMFTIIRTRRSSFSFKDTSYSLNLSSVH